MSESYFNVTVRLRVQSSDSHTAARIALNAIEAYWSDPERAASVFWRYKPTVDVIAQGKKLSEGFDIEELRT